MKSKKDNSRMPACLKSFLAGLNEKEAKAVARYIDEELWLETEMLQILGAKHGSVMDGDF